MAVNGFECLVEEPTRVTDQSETCIDHVYVRVANKNTVSVDAAVIHAGITDHSMVQVSVAVRLLGGGGEGAEPVSPSTPPAARTRICYALLKQIAGGAWLVTDMRRGENILELDPAAQEEVDRGIEEDGSNLSGVSARCSWSEFNQLFTPGESGGLATPPLSPHSDSEQIQAALKKGSLNTRPVLPPIKGQAERHGIETYKGCKDNSLKNYVYYEDCLSEDMELVSTSQREFTSNLQLRVWHTVTSAAGTPAWRVTSTIRTACVRPRSNSRDTSLESHFYDEDCLSEATELVRTRRLESLHLTFNLESGTLLPAGTPAWRITSTIRTACVRPQTAGTPAWRVTSTIRTVCVRPQSNSRDTSLESHFYDEDCLSEATELVRTRRLESLHLTFNLESGTLLRLQQGHQLGESLLQLELPATRQREFTSNLQLGVWHTVTSGYMIPCQQYYTTIPLLTVLLQQQGHQLGESLLRLELPATRQREFTSNLQLGVWHTVTSRDTSLESHFYDEDCLSEATELVRTRRLESLHLTFNLESGILLPLAIRGRVRHGRHFTFKSVLGDTAITLVAASVTGTFVDADKPYVAHGPWLQVLIPEDFIEIMATSLEPLNNPDQLTLPKTFFWKERKLAITILSDGRYQ
ncbi:hypothetical protein J6590_028799 [Homalodisca vitripennis]|nr:hypothetical protein J6590_028799 [Homalodisca vitripennis]